jgi:hypothetical protein
MSFKEMDVRAGEVVQVIVIEPLLSKPQYHQKKKKKRKWMWDCLFYAPIFFTIYFFSNV